MIPSDLTIVSQLSGFQTVASTTVDGGKVFVLRRISIEIVGRELRNGELDSLNAQWALFANDAIVDGLSALRLNPFGMPVIDTFKAFASGTVLELKKDFAGFSMDPTLLGAEWQVRFYGQLLNPQNVTLPWEYTNVE